MESGSTSPLVSICCLTFNHQDYIKDTLDGFLNQKTNFSFEILIHDDASTDTTPRIIEEYAKNYPEIVKPILQKENQWSKKINPTHKFNWPRAKGKYIAMCEGDDAWVNDEKLQKQVDILEADERISLVTHNAQIFQGLKPVDKYFTPFKCTGTIDPHDLIARRYGTIPTATMLYKSEIARNFPDCFKKAPVGDYYQQLFALIIGDVYHINEVMSIRRYVGNSYTTSKKSLSKLIAIHMKHMKALSCFSEMTDNIYQESLKKFIWKQDLILCVEAFPDVLFHSDLAEKKYLFKVFSSVGIKGWKRILYKKFKH